MRKRCSRSAILPIDSTMSEPSSSRLSIRWSSVEDAALPIVDQFSIQAFDPDLFCLNLGQTKIPVTPEQLDRAQKDPQIDIRTLFRFAMTREDVRRWSQLLGRVLAETESSE